MRKEGRGRCVASEERGEREVCSGEAGEGGLRERRGEVGELEGGGERGRRGGKRGRRGGVLTHTLS